MMDSVLVGVPGFHTPAVGFEAPFAMLEACHERVARTLSLLARLQQHVDQHGVDDQARYAARDVIRYFDLAAPLHHQDEELHVFPGLLASSNRIVVDAVGLLRSQHRDMETAWSSMRAALRLLLDAPAAQAGAGPTLSLDHVLQFTGAYESHIHLEETVVYPAAKALCSPERLQAMGEEMTNRRVIVA
jgi:hemerythrin-like domain-containing protein